MNRDDHEVLWRHGLTAGGGCGSLAGAHTAPMSDPARKLTHQPVDDAPSEDQVVVLEASWQTYERLLAERGECAWPKLSYNDGTLEIMSPSEDHDYISRALHTLVMVYCEESDVECRATGSWTLKSKRARKGTEADESYTFGTRRKSVYDLAIEVVRSRRASSKLPIYAALGVREVWVWQDGAITVHTLRADAYRTAARSKVLSGIDLAQLTAHLSEPSTTRMAKRYRAALRHG